MKFDYSAADSFLAEEIGITPRQLFNEMRNAISSLVMLETPQNRDTMFDIWQTFALCTDFVRLIQPVRTTKKRVK